MTYEVGYRRPPKKSRFKKGVSGNPRGRPKGSNNFLTLLGQELEKPITINEDGKKKNITRMQAIVMRMVAGALQGEQKSVLSLIEILRRTGQFEESEMDDFLPEDYEAILNAYVSRKQAAQKKNKNNGGKK